ncbi:hypothetical protein MLD38_024723 [Melastoma candidum]|uniref:Uncharacterized protein n=1 Tax=Melastoma candidum TaxID=119954 RepID=A0ACB9NSW1_9MYRT|nr:hypothetical protein MLD38_024723 [Melastoma candidum]
MSVPVRFLLLLALSLPSSLGGTLFADLANANHRHLILPLSSSPSGDYLIDDDRRRRRLLGSPSSARMRLYDDLLADGYYTTRIGVGTPPQEFSLIVDTGSTVTYVPCRNCEKCGKHQDPRFRPDLSSTYQPVRCNAGCNCDDQGKQCTYQRRYAEMSSSSGVLGTDIISFGNSSELSPQRAMFGCETAESGDLYSQRADGIMGLGRGQLSIVDQLVQKDAIDDSFSLCYGGMGVGGGAMILGWISPPSGMVFSPSDPRRSPYYNIKLKEIHVAGEALRLRANTFDETHGTVLDSGTTYAYLPKEAFNAFKNSIIKNVGSLKRISGPDPKFPDICFAGAGWVLSRLPEIFPTVDMVFSNGQKFSLSPENYLFRHTKVPGAYCLGIFQNENDGTTLLGGIIVRNTLVTYDRENNRIGFWKTNCSELGKTKKDDSSSLPPPNPSLAPRIPPPRPNTSSATAPTQSPSTSPTDIFPGGLQVGVITFDMLFSVDTSYGPKPNITELAELIARELGINVTQVRLLNVRSTENKTDIQWAIFPAKPGNFFNDSTAVNIILSLRDHRLQLPKEFGDYQLLEWKVESPEGRRTWRWRSNLVVAATAGLAVLVGLSIFGMWYGWRKKREAYLAYKPVVEAALPEQELQPV